MIKKLSVILPYYHESYEGLIRGIKKIEVFLKKRKIPFEIIISQNGTREKIKSPFSHTVIVYDKRSGLGRAIKNAARIAKGDYCYFLSAEIPFNLTDLKNILKVYHNYDLVIGSKLHPSSIYKINLKRKLISKLLSFLTKITLQIKNVSDPNGTFFVRTKVLVATSSKVLSNDYFFNTELVYRITKIGYRVIEVPVKYVKSDSTSSVKLIDGIHYLLRLLLLPFKGTHKYSS